MTRKTDSVVYTIGYGSRSIEQFISTLSRYCILTVVDVRSYPFSRHKPEFSQPQLAKALEQSNIRYVPRGRQLGGRPDDPECYISDRVDYDKYRLKETYRRGIEQLVKDVRGQSSIVLMCSEAKPEACHRSKLLGVSLQEQGIQVLHIDEKGEIKAQGEVADLLTGKQLGLFGNPTAGLRSRRKYRNGNSEN